MQSEGADRGLVDLTPRGLRGEAMLGLVGPARRRPEFRYVYSHSLAFFVFFVFCAGKGACLQGRLCCKAN